MKYIDLHADTIFAILHQGDSGSLLKNKMTHIDIQRLQQGSALAQCFAVWLPDPEYHDIDHIAQLAPTTVAEDRAYIDLAVARLQNEVAQASDLIAWAKNTSDIKANETDGKISAILTLEDARAVDGSLDYIEHLHTQGFQMIGLIWNKENCFAYPNSLQSNENSKGLKSFGLEGLHLMDDLGITIDVSHLNDGGISDVLKYAKNPVVASHSNARAIAKHSRNLTDEYIKGIAETGGVAGVCISPRFIRGYDENVSTIDDMIRHLDHIYQVGGEDILAIGTDFDGTGGQIELNSPAKMPLLFERLIKHGWPLERIEKLAYKNALRVFDK